MSDLCQTESQTDIKLLTTNQTQLTNSSSLIDLPLITSGICQ